MYIWKRTKSRLRLLEGRHMGLASANLGNSKPRFRISKSRQVDDRDVGMWITRYISIRKIQSTALTTVNLL